MLKIKNNGQILFDGSEVDFNTINKEQFMLANLTMPIEFENGVTLKTFLDVIDPIKSFLNKCFSDDFIVLKTLTEAGVLAKENTQIVFKKQFEKDENGFVALSVFSEILYGDSNVKKASEVPLFLNDTIEFNQDDDVFVKGEYRSKFTFYEILCALFDDVLYDFQSCNLLI